jgi:hypothetical protein
MFTDSVIISGTHQRMSLAVRTLSLCLSSDTAATYVANIRSTFCTPTKNMIVLFKSRVASDKEVTPCYL